MIALKNRSAGDRYASPGVVYQSKVYHLLVDSPSIIEYRGNYLLASKHNYYTQGITLDDLEAICSHDMHIQHRNRLMINLNKFGSFWELRYYFNSITIS